MKLIKYLYLSPGGFSLPYMMGICQFIKEHYNLKNYNYIGASAGSWLSVYLASDMLDTEPLLLNYNELFEDKNLIYKWNNICPFLINEFSDNIKNSKFVRKKNILVSISNYDTTNKIISNELVNDYKNLHELLNLCLISSYIPFLSGRNIPKRNNLITFDGVFSEPNFDNYNIKLKISNDMFGRHFTFSEILGKNKVSINELLDIGYQDSIKNKEMLDLIFLN